jgi:hypothetical protein
MYLQFFLSEDTAPLSEEQKDVYRQFNANQVLPVAKKGTRQLVRGIIEENDLKELTYILACAGKNVSIVLSHYEDGTAVVEKKPEYDDFFTPVPVTDANGLPVLDEKGEQVILTPSMNTGGGWVFPWDKVEEPINEEIIIE